MAETTGKVRIIVPPGSEQTLPLEFIDKARIIVDNIKVEGGATTTEPFAHIVCLSDRVHDQLYMFDHTEAAQNGYMLVYHARHVTSNPIDVRKLRNVKAILDIESLTYGHSRLGPEDHLIGFSDKLGIPLLNIMDRGDRVMDTLSGAIRKLDTDSRSESQPIGHLGIRTGRFRVQTDTQTHQAAIIDLRK